MKRAGDKITLRAASGVTEYRIMTPGRRLVEPVLARTALNVVYIEAGRPRSARRHLAEVLGGLKGDVRINDPYYGVRSLDSLALITGASRVRFLTARTNENQGAVGRAIADFRREHPHVQLGAITAPTTMHDRYVLTDDTLILVGHGLKDIGGKESFVIRLDREVAEGLIAELGAAFEAKWASATPL